jgi:hypothetical protein
MDDIVRKKEIYEKKETIGVNARNTKLIGSMEAILTKHRHWGMNIAIGGAGNISQGVTKTQILSNGEHGHVYMYYMSPKENRFGGIMIGVEGSEFGKNSQVGSSHTIKAESSFIGVTYGYKWNYLKDIGSQGLGYGLPDKYDSLFIDLSDGWKFLKDEMLNWDDNFVKEPAEKFKQNSSPILFQLD